MGLSWNYSSKQTATITKQSTTYYYKACGYEFRSADILKELDLPTSGLGRNIQLCIAIADQLINNMVLDYLIDFRTL